MPMDSEPATAGSGNARYRYDSPQTFMAGSARTILRGTSTIFWLAGDSMRRPLGSTRKLMTCSRFRPASLLRRSHSVALAALSRLNQDPVRFRRYLANSLGIIAFVGMAVGADLTLVGKDVVRLVLGPKWSESGRIFELFGPGIGVMLLSSTVGWIHLSIGKPGRWLRWTLVETAVTALLFLVALPWGPAGIAVAWSVSFWILLIPAFWYAGRPIGFGVSSLIAAVWRYAAASLLAGLATAAIVRGTPISASPAGAGAALEAVIIHFVTVRDPLSGHGHPVALGLCASAPACEPSTRTRPCTKSHETGRRNRLTMQMSQQATHPERQPPATSQGHDGGLRWRQPGSYSEGSSL